MAKENTKAFRKAVTIFIDILGSQDREKFSEWYNIMKIFTQTVMNEKELDATHPHTIYKREIHVFSDCAYIVYDYKDDIEDSRKNTDALMCIACYNTEKVLFEFLRRGFIARGAVTYGDIYYDEDEHVWFGPAMNTAYVLENKKAKYPRVIIDPDFADSLVDYNNRHYRNDELKRLINGEILRKDEDGIYYIHYLNSYEHGVNLIENDDLLSNVLSLCEIEREKPRKTPETQRSIQQEYEWLERYVRNAASNLEWEG